MIVRIMYETVDGKIFEDKENAEEHEKELLRKEENEQLKKCMEFIKEYYKDKGGCNDCIITSFCTKESDESNKVYNAMRILREYCENIAASCEECVMEECCEKIPQEWKV